ncbi:hypothetical protein LX36DRAFT_705924 [Colletotrichum falcatum]|nr:hypothetical protein LX36DRAFT_705924 [Colletotrichum falcatum]
MEAAAILARYHSGVQDPTEGHTLLYRDKRVDGPSPSEEMVSVVSCYSALVLKTIDIADIFTKILINGLLQIFNFDAALTSAFLVDSLGIRILFLWSGADMSASYVVWTPCSAVSTKTGSKPAGIVVVIYLLTSYFHYDIAYTPLLLGCPNEMLPYSLRSEGNAVELSAIYESFTITTFANPIGLEDIGRKYYIVSCCLPVVFFAVTLHLLPKTKGHSLEEIPVICDGLQAVEDFEDGPNSKGEKALVKGELHDLKDATHRDIQLLEAHTTDDFEWDKQDTLTNYSASSDAELEVDMNGDATADPTADGMASLTVSEKGSGYLGVASGAALTRLLEPSTTKQPTRHITDAMIDAYFRLYHVSHPTIHEATFRAQYAGVIPRPYGGCWPVLAYTVTAIGVYTTATNLDNMDMSLFAQARSIRSFNFLEVGNPTLVHALTLISNYQQKRDRPNSGYNHLRMAVRMAMGLGLHKEFRDWNISPLNVEIGRRVRWPLCIFDVGATITLSRPSVWPHEGVEVSLPLNVDDKPLTAISKSYPARTQDGTPYTAVRMQASFHVATTPIYEKVISKPLTTADEMLKLGQELLEP